VHLVTRHPRAAEVAADLKSAGLDLLNFSLDSLNGKTWKKITRTSGHGTLIEAVRKCAKLGLPMKLNMVVLRDVNDHEIAEMVRFAGDIGADLKLLDLIGDITDESQKTSGLQKYYTSLDAQGEWLATVATDCSVVTAPGGLGHPMPQYSMPSGVKVMIKSAHFGAYYGATCSECQHYPCWDALMALRVTANGMLQYCLVRDDNLVDLLGMLRRGDAAEAERAVASVLAVYRNASPIAGKDLQRLRAEKATRSVAS
jgi:cyclic pyranopterin phosphate synthase